MAYFCIDLAYNGKPIPTQKIEICEYLDEDLKADLKIEGLKNPLDLTDFDRMVFETEAEAEKFLKEYLIQEKRLTTGMRAWVNDVPAMAYRKRHLVLGLMGLKMKTSRHYKKDWEPGQVFNLHDRTNFVTVILQKITEDEKGEFTYHFKLW